MNEMPLSETEQSLRATYDSLHAQLLALQEQVQGFAGAFPQERFPRNGTGLRIVQRRLGEAATTVQLVMESITSGEEAHTV
jgi:hypothetical protein